MKQWFSLSDLEELRLDGLPASRRGLVNLIEREGWREDSALTRLRTGPGGGHEFALQRLPLRAQLDYAARFIDVEAHRGAAADMTADEDATGPLTGGRAIERDARLAILAVLTGFRRRADLPVAVADKMFARLYKAGKVPMSGWIKEVIPAVSARSLARWRAAYRAGETRRLGFDRAARKGTGLLDRAEEGRVKTFCLALMSKNRHLTAEHIRNTVLAEFGKTLDIADADTGEIKSKPVPPIRTFQHALKKWKAEHRTALTKIADPDRYKSSVRFALTNSTFCARLNELWLADASPVDLLTQSGRRNLYATIDVHSRRALFLVTDTPRAAAFGLMIRKAILQWGVPEALKSDNGSDFTARDIVRLLDSLGVTHELCAPFSPEQKGIVERVIKTIQHGLMPTLPGFIGHSVADRKVIEGRKGFSQRLGEKPDTLLQVDLTDDELQDYIDRWADDIYAHKPHGGLKDRAPFEMAAAYHGKVRRIENAHALDLLLAPVPDNNGIRKVTRSGIRIGGEHYFIGTVMPGETVFCRHDPADLGRVLVFSEDGETYLGEAVCPDLAGLDPAATIAAVKARQEAVIKGEVAEIRRAARRIGPRDVADAQFAAAEKKAGTLVAFPRTSDSHETPAITAVETAFEARSKPDTAPLEGRAAALHEALKSETAEAAAQSTAGSNVQALRPHETREQRFRRARDLERRLADGEAVNPDDLLWLGGYQAGPEYRAMKTMLDDFGEQALR